MFGSNKKEQIRHGPDDIKGGDEWPQERGLSFARALWRSPRKW
jgi:hypothetical protein